MLLSRIRFETDIAVQRAEEREIAFAEGIEQGISQGSYQKALETAKVLKQLGDSVEKIIQATGLSQEEVESI